MRERLELILDELIKNYLNLKKPISSSSLKKLSNLEISPSTIRGYFQSLEEIGMIEKEHFASGSYPTKKAMENFWKKYFPDSFDFSIKKLEEKAKEFDIAVIVEMFENELLNRVYNFNDKFIILEFESEEIVLRYSKEVFNFLKSLEKIFSLDLITISNHYKLNFLLKKLEIFQKEFTFNKKMLYNKFNEVDIINLNQLDDTLIIKKDVIIKKFHLTKDNNKIDITLIGDIYSNFVTFFEELKGGENEEEKEKRN